jgi:hypothetical protein
MLQRIPYSSLGSFQAFTPNMVAALNLTESTALESLPSHHIVPQKASDVPAIQGLRNAPASKQLRLAFSRKTNSQADNSFDFSLQVLSLELTAPI